jgi:organic radical activating enzyme
MSVKLSQKIGNNFCYAPWTNIHIDTSGEYKTCCAGSERLGDLKTVSIKNLLADSKLLQIKTSLLNNQYHTNCKECVNIEKTIPHSERHWYIDICDNKEIQLDTINDQHLQNLDIRWSNTCNLSCVYCDSNASSQWANLKKQNIHRLDYSNTLPDILSFIKDNKDSIKQIALLGGEPLLQKENDFLLDVIEDNVFVYVITNLSVPLENNKIFQKIIKKNNVVWDISFETTEEKFEYVRHGAKWDLLVKNIKYLQECIKHKPGHGIGVTSQYSIYNALELSNLYKKLQQYEFPLMRWNELSNPKELRVSNLPQKFIDRAIAELEYCASLQFSGDTFLEEMASSLKNVNSTTTNCDYLFAWHEWQEQTYWPNFQYKFENLWSYYKE